ncbi:MAG: SCO family protein [Gammaproteobacteria bacterium]
MPTLRNSSTSRLVLKAVIIAVLATAAGIWSARLVLHRQVVEDELSATRFPVARDVQPFALVDHNNAVFDNAALQQRWSFLFFGYTYCPDVCPTTLSVLNSIAQRLQDIDEDIRFVMVTVDPERDTPERLAEYVTYFNGDFIGVTGSDEALQQLTRQLGILYNRVEPEAGSDNYLIDHTAAVFLFDPDGHYHAVFTPPLSAEKIAGDFRKMLQATQ